MGAVKKRHPVFGFIKRAASLFVKAPSIREVDEKDTAGSGIYIANHAAASGPFTYELFFPRTFRPWGTHEMCGNYRERWNYLYHIFYIQKKGYSKFAAFIVATPFAVISRLLYKGAELIPTYRDMRFRKTLRRSFETLDDGENLLIFPENSSDGYKEKITEYFGGFIIVAKNYYELTGRDVPIRCVYYNKKKNTITIDTPQFLQQVITSLGSRDTRILAEFFLNRTNSLAQQ